VFSCIITVLLFTSCIVALCFMFLVCSLCVLLCWPLWFLYAVFAS